MSSSTTPPPNMLPPTMPPPTPLHGTTVAPSSPGAVGSDLRHQSAAARVYRIDELWNAILQLASQRTLCVIMRTEKAAFNESVKILYKRLPVSAVAGMHAKVIKSKVDPVRQICYYSAVKIIDSSPLPPFEGGQKAYLLELKHGRHREPVRFVLSQAQKMVTVWHKRFPHLHTALYLYPTHPADERYVAHIDEKGKIHKVEVETLVNLNISSYLGAGQGPPQLPPAPVYLGATCVHTMVLKLVAEAGGSAAEEAWRKTQQGKDTHRALWRSYLYDNPHVDDRVSGIDTSSVPWFLAPLTTVELHIYLAHRLAADCTPLTHFSLQHADDLTPTVLHNLRGTLGSSIRVLSIDDTILASFGAMQTTVCELGKAFQRLDELSIGFEANSADPLSMSTPPHGLCRLRKIVLTGRTHEVVGAMSNYIKGLGADECVFQDPRKQYTRLSNNFDAQVKHARINQLAANVIN